MKVIGLYTIVCNKGTVSEIVFVRKMLLLVLNILFKVEKSKLFSVEISS